MAIKAQTQQSEQLTIPLPGEFLVSEYAAPLLEKIQQAKYLSALRQREVSSGHLAVLLSQGKIGLDEYAALQAAKETRRGALRLSPEAAIPEDIPESMTAPGAPDAETTDWTQTDQLVTVPLTNTRQFDWAERAAGEHKDHY